MPDPLHQPPLAPTRDPYPSELEFFRKNPNVAGYAAPDNKVVVNPFNRLTPEENMALIENESARIFMRQDHSARPTEQSFPLTPQQQKMPYPKSPPPQDPQHALRSTVAARMVAGDPSAGRTTEAQEKFFEELRARMLGNAVDK